MYIYRPHKSTRESNVCTWTCLSLDRRGVPHPAWWGRGYPIQPNRVVPPSLDGGMGYPIQPDQREYYHLWPRGYPIQPWGGGEYPVQDWIGVPPLSGLDGVPLLGQVGVPTSLLGLDGVPPPGEWMTLGQVMPRAVRFPQEDCLVLQYHFVDKLPQFCPTLESI